VDRFSWLAWGVGISVALVQPAVLAKSATEVNDIAKAISVKISTTDGNGSGILLQKQGDVYTILTAAHVVKNARASYRITTPDGRSYQPIANSIRRYQGDVDLAVLKFRSSATYKLAELGDSNTLKGGMEIYVAGFPLPTTVITESIFFFREGKVTANSKRSFKNGYSLVYSNDTLPGMSGGPVLNTDGQVVGVHGKGDREINSSTGKPDGPKTGFNTAIPIARFADIAQSLGITLGTRVAQTIQSTTLTADDYLLSAKQKYEKNDVRGTLADLNKAISLNPKFADAYSGRGVVKASNFKDFQGALADLNKAISLNPKNVLAYNNRGFVKGKLKDFQGALGDYNQAISLDSKSVSAYIGRGNVKEKLNDLQGALADFDQAISLDSKSVSAYIGRGNVKVNKLNDFQGAFADYNQAISLDPKSADAYAGRGAVKVYSKDLQGALADFNKAISLDPKSADAYAGRGVIKAIKLNDRQGAISDLRIAAKIFRAQGQTENLQAIIKFLRQLGASE
jgi:tetratricopeptide (TPR) repeat protein